MHADIRYDRRVSPEFLAHFAQGGVAHSLVEFATSRLCPLDLQFRKDAKSGAEHATLYAGLTAVLNVVGTKSGFRLRAHAIWANKANGFVDEWLTSASPDAWSERWVLVEKYLERVIPLAVKSHGVTEGAVQSAVSSHGDTQRVMLDREVTPSFRDKPFKDAVLEECKRPILEALAELDLGAGKVPSSFGAECDLLAVADDGRLLAVEVKPYNGAGVPWVPAQAAMYARVLQQWVDADDTPGDGPHQVLSGMLSQRQQIGLAGAFEFKLPEKLTVTPVVALQRGASETQVKRMLQVRDAIDGADLGIPPLEIYEVSFTGRLLEL